MIERVQPVPFKVSYGNDGASAFIASNGSTSWLVTCLHLISGKQHTPITFEPPPGATLNIRDLSISIPLHMVKGRLNCVISSGQNKYFDVLAVRLNSLEVGALGVFGAYDIRSFPKVNERQRLIMKGYPIKNGHQSSMIERVVTVERVHGVSIMMRDPSVGGISGGPLLDDNRLVGIMHGSVGSPPKFENALANSFAVLGPSLFV